jgi:hypothetical protein
MFGINIIKDQPEPNPDSYELKRMLRTVVSFLARKKMLWMIKSPEIEEWWVAESARIEREKAALR